MAGYTTGTAKEPKEEEEKEEMWKGITTSRQGTLLGVVTAVKNKAQRGHTQKG